tara:strand:+ start:58 stop:231 length:174 start_codon:yes stop_codon:yes gene_type:complete
MFLLINIPALPRYIIRNAGKQVKRKNSGLDLSRTPRYPSEKTRNPAIPSVITYAVRK